MQISSRLMAAPWLICGHLGIISQVENTRYRQPNGCPWIIATVGRGEEAWPNAIGDGNRVAAVRHQLDYQELARRRRKISVISRPDMAPRKPSSSRPSSRSRAVLTKAESATRTMAPPTPMRL